MAEIQKQASDQMEKYFKELDDNVNECHRIAFKALKMGYDPETVVDIKLARNMAERVEGLISSAAPQLIGSGMTERIMELEKKYSPLDWRVALEIGEEVAKEKFCKFKDKREAMEVGIRVGFAYHTSGIVAAPLEGFVELKIKKRKDGKEYFSPCYAGPIRGAGGTAASFSLLLTDYVRMKMGFGVWDATEEEIGRIKTEITDYHERVTNLQYFPSEKELDFLLRNIPVEVSGDPTEKFEVPNYKDIERIGTNRIRGGICLVLAEGLSQKAPKIWKRLEKWGEEMGLSHWSFLKEFIDIKKGIHSKMAPGKDGGDADKKPKVMPNYTFIKDLVAGRPVLAFPMREGGFRLRYGRSRCSGFSAAGIHPATMNVLDKFIATGTQFKVERPGKAASVVPCDTIMGPVVKLKNGNVLEIRNASEAREVSKELDKILFLGDILFNYGDFSENGHGLVPAGYNEEWWALDVEKKTVELFGNLDFDKLSMHTDIDRDYLESIISRPNAHRPNFKTSLKISLKLSVPLHPRHTFFWSLLDVDEIKKIVIWLKEASIKYDEDKIIKAVFPYSPSRKELLEKAGIPHLFVGNEFVVLEKDIASAFLFTLGFLSGNEKKKIADLLDEDKDVLQNLKTFCGVTIMDKAGTFIGARMGRPEKAKHRKMVGSPHTLFPVGEEGGRLRSFQAALDTGYVESEFILKHCRKCKKDTIYNSCESCGGKTQQRFYCSSCEKETDKEECPLHGKNNGFIRKRLDIKHYFDDAVKKLGLKMYPNLIKGVRGTSNKDHITEHLAKGILRAKHGIFVNKDGTARFDMTELPMTHFRPKEIGVSVGKLKELGYSKDCRGKALEHAEQMVELKPHDIVMPASTEALDEQSDNILLRVGQFVDDLLVNLYKQEPFYNFNKKEDLIGHLVVGLAPHISAGTVGRIIGFTQTQGFFAHPLMHAAFRRDCDGDEAAVILLLDAFLNFSRKYLPNSRGAKTMDAPLVLSSRIIPTEVDDMVHGLDTVWKYPLDFYKACEGFKNPWDVKIEQVKKFLNTERQYEGYGFTHDISDINMGITCSAYKSLPSMEEKLRGQMELAERIRAVDENEVAQFVINKHFLKDTKGNLRKFSMQQFRCVKCNEKYRRPPLKGKCKCGGRLIFTISQGSVIKYLEPSLSLAKKYKVPAYLKQTLELLSLRVDEVFGKDKEKQEGLGKWFG